MGRTTSLVVSWTPARCEPLLGLLRARGLCPSVSDDIEQAALAAVKPENVVILLHGSQVFCESFFDAVSGRQSQRDLCPIVILACGSSESFVISALRKGAKDYLSEPLDMAALEETISRVVPHCPSAQPDVPLTGGDVLIGASHIMQALRANIRRIAATECNVLITGETGTGKELVAQLIHQNSRRSNHPLICINCAAIPDSLLESELFGYERGAFTGASAASPGKLMTANKGTVFFDEIGDMSSSGQAKILRAIEAKEVQRLGATRRYETDIRILAATHHNLDALASAQTFRRDLYFRLNVGRIHLPPLRERKSDIPGLVERMVTELNRKLGRHVESANETAMRALTQYDWPGNVRELKNVIERIFINRDSGRITAEDLTNVLQTGYGTDTVQEDEDEQNLRDALATCNGNKSKAAERLNCSRMTLYRKMAKYGMGESDSKPLPGIGHLDELGTSKKLA